MTLWQDRRLKGLCGRCGKPSKNTSRCEICKDKMKEYSSTECQKMNKKQTYREWYNTKEKLRRKHIKEQIFSVYGNMCACCGENELAFLTIDHIDNNGAEHRRLTKAVGIGFYRWLIKNNYPLGFQTLCWNCNCGKRINNGICPHKSIKDQASSCFGDL
jgi:hypothetical protein